MKRRESGEQKTENRRGRAESGRFARRVNACRRAVFLLAPGFWLLTSFLCFAQTPRDLPRSHWAGAAVHEALRNGVMTLDSRQAFHGEAKVTQTQAAIALAKVALRLEARAWRGEASGALPAPKSSLGVGAWERQTVTRYELASVLARAGDYAANGIRPAAKHSADSGKSVVLPEPPTVKLARNHSAYSAVAYLASRRMISANSPLMKPTNAPITAGQLRVALSQMLVGLTDRLTDLGHDKDGNTLDRSFHK